MNLLRSREGRGKEDLGLFLLLLFWRLGETIVQKRRAANYVTGGKEGIFTALWRPAQDGGRRDDGCLFFFSSSTAASRHFQWRLTQRCVTFIISGVFPSIPLLGRRDGFEKLYASSSRVRVLGLRVRVESSLGLRVRVESRQCELAIKTVVF